MEIDTENSTNDLRPERSPFVDLKDQEVEEALKSLSLGGGTDAPSDKEPLRAKTSLRMHYEAEVNVIRKKLGSIEDIRQKMGLSRRKICQLLMVDPSAWTRWSKDERKVPPHIFRALQWYTALIDKEPAWHPQNAFLGAFRAESDRALQVEKRLSEKIQKIQQEGLSNVGVSAIQAEIAALKARNASLLEELQKSQQSQAGWKVLLLLNTLVLLGALVWFV